MRSKEEIELCILKKIGQKVIFDYPNHEGKRVGFLKDRVVIASDWSSSGIPYLDIVDLIEFPNEIEKSWMRIGYYRYLKENDRLVWGSQTTITEPLAVWSKLFSAVKSRPWFQGVLSGSAVAGREEGVS